MMWILLMFALPIEDESRLFNEAQEAYWRGLEQRADAAQARPLFAQSAQAYEQLWRAGYRHATLAADRGQAYLLAGDIPNAIRAFREGVQLEPSHRRSRRGLSDARDRVIFPRSGTMMQHAMIDEPWRLSAWLNPVAAFWLGFTSYALAWYAWSRRWRGVAIGCGAAVMLLWGTLAIEAWGRDVQPFLVVVRDGTVLRQGNADSYPARLEEPLPRGVEANILHERGGWWQIELADGTVGWVPSQAVVVADSARISVDQSLQ